MSKIKDFLKSPLGTALCAAAACLLAVVLVWLAAVRPNNDKSLSERISDDYSQYSAELDEANGAAQTFDTDNDLLAMAFVFGTSNGQPTGELHLELADADTGEVLARSTGDMANIVAGQYTGMGLDTPVTGSAGRRYRVTLKPEYTGSGRLTVGCSNGAVLWNDTFTVNGEAVDGTLALLVTYKQIGGFLTRFFLLVGLLASVVVFLGIYFAMRGRMPLHRLVFVLVLCFGMLYSFVLPPYAAPDEKYHINQSFTLACKWANMLSPDEWRMGNVPLDMTYRREHDFDPLLQNEKTTVFSWQELSENLFTTTPDSFDSHTALEELQTDRNPTLYLFSAAAVFLAYVFHLGFVPALMLGRTANLIVFALLAALAVKAAPFGRRVFAAAALLPMTLHLAASFSRDSLLLGLAFAFSALCMQAIFGCKDGTVLPVRLWLPLAVFGILLAPAKLVYLPLAALFLLIPNSRFGQSAATKKAAYLAGCVLLALSINRAVLVTSVAGSAGFENQTTQTETTSAQGSTPAAAVSYTATEAADNRTLHAAPAAGDGKTSNRFANMPAEYRENTASNFVRRLYYCVEGVTEIPQKELEFWVQALQEGDVTAAVLGQSFFFSPEEVEHSSLTDDEFMSAASLVYLDRDLMTTDAEMCRERLATADRRDFFKSMFSSDECAELLSACQIYPGVEDDRYPLDRNVLIKEIEAVRTVRDSQSTPSEEDQTTFTPGYILHNLPAVAMLLVRSVVQDADNWVRGLVGGSLSYSSLDLAWFWVLALYLLLWYAAVPAQDVPVPGLPQGRYRVWCALAALLCAALAFAGCLVWTPTYYQTVYGFQGRYLLPVLPLFLLTCLPRRVQVASGKQSACTLVCCQSFFFSPEEVEHSSLTDDEFMSAASLVYLDRDLMTTDAEMCRERLATADRRDFFKSMFSSDECAELLSACQIYPGVEDDRYPLDRNVLIKEIEAVRTVRDSQSTPSEEDQTTFTPGYILHNLPAVAMLLVRSVVQDADNWVRGLVGGSLSYSSLDLAWFWVLALYLLLWYAAVPAQDVPVPGLPQGRYRVWCALAALLCAALAFAGCLVWTPTYYQTVYGFQGRYLLPVLPLFLLTCLPRRVQVASGKQSACTLVCCLCAVNAGVLLNAMLAVIAR